ncbi:MAG TPA: PP2C family serine/threonine-protein phosphatase [Pirellulales bacterium]|nr:PP2C family serine/threonine-protein phosphatase [Pirellulales bacterium]
MRVKIVKAEYLQRRRNAGPPRAIIHFPTVGMDPKPVNWETGIEHAAISDVGLRRSNNQDSYAVALAGAPELWARRGHLFMVSDGMGAHAAGELASKMATDTVPHTYNKLLEEPPPGAIRQAIEDANGRIHTRGQANLDFRGMGTTTSALVLLPEGALVAHVGDSRVYRVRENRIEQLSFDHSLVWEMMAAGKIRESEVPSYIPKNIITRSLGPSAHVQVDLEGPYPLAPGDTFLLCSDGLSGQVSDEEMGAILGALPPREAAQMLVDLANLRGGPDNITVIVIRVGELPRAPLAPQTPVRNRAAARPIHPVVWILLGVLTLATLLLLVAHHFEVAIFTALGALVVGAALLVRRFGGAGTQTGYGQRFGRGPYTSRPCPTNNDFVDKLAKVVAQLREAATEENWSIDWTRFNTFDSRAMAAAESKQYQEAVREYGHAMCFMMDEIRGQRRKKNNGRSPGFDGG